MPNSLRSNGRVAPHVAKKKKRRSARAAAGRSRNRRPPGRPRRPPSESARKRRARARAKQAKAAVRRGALRRAADRRLVGLLVFVAISWFINRAPAPTPLSADAAAAAVAAWVRATSQTGRERDPAASTSQSGQAYTYTEHPATSGYARPHAPARPAPRLYDRRSRLPRDAGRAHARARVGDHVLPADRRRRAAPDRSSTDSGRSPRTTRRPT